MPEFFNVVTVQEALSIMEKYLKPLAGIVEIKIEEALGRIVAEDISAAADLPAFSRSTMDGYAIHADDSYGGSEGLPAYLKVIGEMPMGQPVPLRADRGEAVKIHTGGMLPEGTDARSHLEPGV